MKLPACSVVSLAALGVSAACSAPPTSPSREFGLPASPQAPPPPLAAIRLEGRIVGGRDQPVPDARISFPNTVALAPVVSGSTGHYAVSVNGGLLGMTIFVEKPGFEPSQHSVGWPGALPGGTALRDLRLHEIRWVTAGESFEVSILPDDPYCTPGFDDLAICGRVRVRSPRAGVLRVSADPPFWIFLNGGQNGPLAVSAGGETLVEALLYDTPPRSTIVRTTLESP